MTRRPSRTILSNLNSDTMVENPTDRYLRAMAVPTPRMLWEAEPGDCVVMLAPCPAPFREYVARTLGLDIDRVDIVAPPRTALVHPLEMADALGAGDLLTARPVLDPFALDRQVLDYARRTGVRLHAYDAPPPDTLLDTVRYINTKAGIRETALSLGLPVAAGGFAATRAELVDRVVAFLDDHPAAIVKANRSSTGFGNTVVEAGPGHTRKQRVTEALAEDPDRASGWIYEEFLPLTASPSFEMTAEEDGVTDYYSCDQRTVDNGWTGMVTPAVDGPSTPHMRAAARKIGGWLHTRGYRGIFDVDCATHPGGYVVTEANVRTTGGTYLEKLARRLRPGEFPVHWRADGRFGAATGGPDFAEAVRRLDAEGLGDPAGPVRAVLPTDTRDIDGKWRYLVVGKDADSVAEAERTVERILELP
ncbi:peptide ligase PGM1-related protein [Streptomyces sp. NBC_01565]|uniref:preATP grasp domain-containing protein n=1 Tax=unclassified Streptomyces TaxID=2593676 RepID=UPI00224D3D43|nr:peptide ligase PGM1-related protein [Streptomyces sp. NBC_01565]MCX4539393.1 peptide ligase PGM1-related protein [Streptomyces sp. NBC_01565]